MPLNRHPPVINHSETEGNLSVGKNIYKLADFAEKT